MAIHPLCDFQHCFDVLATLLAGNDSYVHIMQGHLKPIVMDKFGLKKIVGSEKISAQFSKIMSHYCL